VHSMRASEGPVTGTGLGGICYSRARVNSNDLPPVAYDPWVAEAGTRVRLCLSADVPLQRHPSASSGHCGGRGLARRFVLEAQGITADEAALALSAAKGLAGLKTRDVAAQTLR
jgi:hypothetical protein